jgi:hypothetical protein
MQPIRVGRRAACVVAMAILLVVGVLELARPPAAQGQAAGLVPTQWVAKQFTELLGRAPTTAEWNDWTTYYSGPGCTTDSLKTKSRELLVGSEFASRYPEASAKAGRVIALVRAIYNHEPNSNDWNAAYVPYANGTKTWTQVVDGMFNFGWAGMVVPSVCATADPGYGYGASPVLDVRSLAGLGTSRSAATLQGQLDAAAATCGTVSLQPYEVVRINGALIQVPPCVRLTTAGAPSVQAYASQGRIVGEGNTCIAGTYICVDMPLVSLGSGAELRNVWVDVRNATAGRKTVGVQLGGSTTADPGVVDNVRVTDPGAGGTGIRVLGFSTTANACEAARVTNNVVTGYARSHAVDRAARAQWADGISVHCEDTLVETNDIVDVGDWGIGLHGAWNRDVIWVGIPQRPQKSVVRSNKILSAGVPGSVAIGIDPAGWCLPSGGGLPVPCIDSPAERSFAGTVVEANTFWTSSRTSFDVGLMVGGKTYWGDHAAYGRGAVVRNNTTGTASARVNVGIAVSGMYDTTLTGNTGSGGNPGSFTLVDTIGDASGDLAGCPLVAVGDTRPYLMSFVAGAQPSTTTGLYGCLLAPFPTGGLERLTTSTAGGGTFVGASTGVTFVPWGHNYGPVEGLLDDDSWYQPARFAEIVSDLRELKQMGATVLRIHPQLNKFMTGPTTVKPAAFDQMNRLAVVAEKLGLYLDITGLGAARKADNNLPDTQPGVADADDWLSDTNEEQRWHAQEIWWEEMARRLKDRTSIAWYNLMNEMVAGNATEWCGPEFGGLCFVQTITLQLGPRDQGTVLRTWIERMRQAIERGEGKLRTQADHTVTASNLLFANKTITGDLDDVMLDHTYPGDIQETANVNEVTTEIQAIKANKITGKPMVLEEFFFALDTDPNPPSYSCDTTTCLERTMYETRPEVNGWIGHASGTTLAQGVPNILAAAWLQLFQKNTPILAPCGTCEPS